MFSRCEDKQSRKGRKEGIIAIVFTNNLFSNNFELHVVDFNCIKNDNLLKNFSCYVVTFSTALI